MLSSIRIAIRSLARRRAISLVAISSIAVGIGVNSAVFSVVDAMFLRPPAVTDPDRLVEIKGNFKDSGSAVLDWADYRNIAEQTSAFSSLTAYMGRGGLWRNGNEMTLLLLDAVDDNYFDMLGVKPILGQLPRASGQNTEQPPVVLTYWLWRERMGGRTDVIGERFEYRDHVWRIAAVLPPHFRGLSPMGQRHVWIPISSWKQNYARDLERGSGQFVVIGRLRPGVGLDQAQVQLDTLSRRMETSDSKVPKGRRLIAASVANEMNSRLRPGVFILAIVSLVLLVACANVASMLLAQVEARRREIGQRLSLGADRAALATQFLAESLALVLPGALAGLLLASWILTAAPALAPPSAVPIHYDFRLDWRLMSYTLGCAGVTLVIFGLAPLVHALRVPLLEAIGGARSVGLDPRSLFRMALVSGQVALAVVLVAGALVLAQALGEANRIDPGFDSSRPLILLSANLESNAPGSRPEQLLFREAVHRIAAVSGVDGVTYARHLPLTNSGAGARIAIIPEGAPADQPPPQVYFNLVGPNFFEVTGARITAGRAFADVDHNGGAPVAIVNAEAARRFWPGANPIGKVLRTSNLSYEVVGVTSDGRLSSLHEAPVPAVLLPASRMSWGETILIARTRMDPAVKLREVEQVAARTNGLRIYQSSTLRTVMKEALYEDWIPTVAGLALAALGLLLAAGGLYGAIFHAVERRRGEFGVRMVVGAKTSEIAMLVLRQAMSFCLIGTPVGIVLFVAAYRYYRETLLHGRALDWSALLAGAALAGVVVLSGALIPALRAARLDPVIVIRGVD